MADVKEKTEWVFDTSGIRTMKDIRLFQEGIASARFGDVYAVCAKIVKAWPYGGEPSKFEAYDELTPAEYGVLLNEVSTALGKLFQPATT